MKLFKSYAIIVMLFSGISLLACGGGGSSDGGGTGTVSVSLTDSASDKYLGDYVTIADVQICEKNTDNASDGNCSWRSLQTENNEPLPNRTYNLLKLVNGVTEAIGSNEFDAGEYNQIRLIIGDTPELKNNLLGDPHPEANYVILKDGNDTIESLKIPSGLQTGIKLVHPFSVGTGVIHELVLDFDADRSVVKAGNSEKYILKPTIKVFETEGKIDVYGKVEDDSATPNPIAGAMVSAQISDGLSATVIRSTTTDGADTDNSLEVGDYLLTLLSPDQIYNIVAYKDYVDGEAFIYSPECTAFRYNDDPEAEPLMNLTLSKENEGIGTISGQIWAAGNVDQDFPLVVTVYTKLDCGRTDGENYVEITKADITGYLGGGVFEYNVTLPIYSSAGVTYYLVASADNYIPETIEAYLEAETPDATGVDIVIEPAG